eukprot:1280119-Prymnesium_polylepis.3
MTRRVHACPFCATLARACHVHTTQVGAGRCSYAERCDGLPNGRAVRVQGARRAAHSPRHARRMCSQRTRSHPR